jgi:hypothetical protein
MYQVLMTVHKTNYCTLKNGKKLRKPANTSISIQNLNFFLLHKNSRAQGTRDG